MSVGETLLPSVRPVGELQLKAILLVSGVGVGLALLVLPPPPQATKKILMNSQINILMLRRDMGDIRQDPKILFLYCYEDNNTIRMNKLLQKFDNV